MALCTYKTDSIDACYEDVVEYYCSCVTMVYNYPSRCGICDRLCPDEKAIYLALRDIEAIRELGRKWAKKTKHQPGTIKRALASIEDRPDVKALVDQYGMDSLQSVVRRLLKDRSFTSDSIAEQRFPGLTAVIVHAEAMSTEPAESTSEKTDWELLVAVEAPVKASEEEPEEIPAKTAEEEPEEATAKSPEEEPEEVTAKSPEEEGIENQRWLEKEPCPTEPYPTEAYEAPAETKALEEEACGDRVQEEQKIGCLPMGSQHNLLVHLQEVLETACFAYGQKTLPTQLRKRGWDCVEAVALRTWMNEFPTMTEAFDTIHRRELLESVVAIQDIAVNRPRIDWPRMNKLLDDALDLTEVLNVKEYSDIVKKVRIDIGKAVEGLNCKKQEAEDQQEEKLQRIAEERRKLDKCEVEVRKYKENRVKDHWKWAESEVEGKLEETRKTLKTARFFIKLVD
ncbi:uncharacterized protein FPRO_03862 [Fusarium proliferatum ET1]|uniref:Uncharacterized protein n=1 Tax=Fusarium proliferatum (strain ET1) TaxID=1227346 RepID=A0A1L7V4S5_FUSPR|nr:uncharacterized protein FPRO_03862 [Fusarium proliferatum ET1]CZR35878.1 uncharacterized protein FPRO_03862 [Fusarium proliferatum ET1]